MYERELQPTADLDRSLHQYIVAVVQNPESLGCDGNVSPSPTA